MRWKRCPRRLLPAPSSFGAWIGSPPACLSPTPMFVPDGSFAGHGMLLSCLGRHRRAPARSAAYAPDRPAKDGRSRLWRTGRPPTSSSKTFSESDFDENRPGRKSAVSEFIQASMDLYAQDSFRCRAFRDENRNVTTGISRAWFFCRRMVLANCLLHEVRAVYSALKNREIRNSQARAQLCRVCAGAAAFAGPRSGCAFDLLASQVEGYAAFPPALRPSQGDGPKGPFLFLCGSGYRGGAWWRFPRRSRVSLTLVLMAAYQLSLARWSGQTEILSAAYTADRIRSANSRTRSAFWSPICRYAAGFEPEHHISAHSFSNSPRSSTAAMRIANCRASSMKRYSRPANPFCGHGFQFRAAAEEFLSPASCIRYRHSGARLSRPTHPGQPYTAKSISAWPNMPNGILGKVFYNADRFTPEGMETFIQHFRNVVQAVADDPNVKLRELLEHSR